jgi:hypothetical protein
VNSVKLGKPFDKRWQSRAKLLADRLNSFVLIVILSTDNYRGSKKKV